MDVGQAQRQLEPLLRPLDLLQGLDQFGDVIGGDHQAADLAGGIAPRLHLGVEPGDAAVGAEVAQTLRRNLPSFGDAGFQLVAPGIIDRRRQVEHRPAGGCRAFQFQVRGP